MSKKPLTDTSLRQLAPKAAQYEISDFTVPGLAVRVSPGGTKSFILYYRVGLRLRKLTLGRYPILSLKEARLKAKTALQEVNEGKDPQALKIEQRQSYQDSLFSAVCTNFIEKYAKRKNRSWKETERLLRKDFVSRWANLRVQDITRKHVHQVLDELLTANGPSAANHAFAAIRKFFNWCVERGEVDNSPCVGLKAPAKFNSRDRVLTDDEVARIWGSLDQMGYPFGPFVKLLFLTGQRREEVASLRWQYLDLDARLWTQPAASNKSNRIHFVPLSDAAIKILQEIPKLHEELVFPARGSATNSISGFSKWKSALDQLSGTSNWTLHDIRRTMATGLASVKISHLVVELLLNHNAASLSGVAAVYNRHDYLDEKREAVERWAAHLAKITAMQPNLIWSDCLASRPTLGPLGTAASS